MILTEHAAARWAERFPGMDVDEAYKLATQFGPAARKVRKQVRAECPDHTEFREDVRYFMSWKNRIVLVVGPKETVITVFKLRFHPDHQTARSVRRVT